LNRLICGALAITGLTSCAPPAAPPSTPAPAASPEPASPPLTVASLKPPLDTLAWYVGKWNCKGIWYPTPEDPKETKWDAILTVEPELGGAWLSVKMFGPGESRSIEHKGFDANEKRWIHVGVTASGWSYSTAPEGWKGNAMVWIQQGIPEKVRATFTKLSETSYSHVVQLETEKGLENFWEKTCTKM
jgi:hypothetical protein